MIYLIYLSDVWNIHTQTVLDFPDRVAYFTTKKVFAPRFQHRRINAGVVALGERTPADRSREASLIPTLYTANEPDGGMVLEQQREDLHVCVQSLTSVIVAAPCMQCFEQSVKSNLRGAQAL